MAEATLDYSALRGDRSEFPSAAPSPSPSGPRAVGSPEWWLKRLHDELTTRKRAYKVYSAYYDGQHPLAFASTKFKKAFGGQLQSFADNWCDLVPDAVEERLNVEGFRFGDDAEGDKDAWRIWQANNLDAGSQMLHTEALVNGCAYALVGIEDGEPVITPESPEQMIVAHRPGTHVRAAALKEWLDEWDERIMATLYLPNRVYKFQSTRKVKSAHDMGEATSLRWVPRRGEEDPEMQNPFGVVPVVPFVNRPRLMADGRSEIHTVIPIQDGVNKLVADMLVTSEFQAFRQRWAIGIEIPVDPDTGEKVEPFKQALDRLWISEKGKDEGIEFGEFSQTDMKPFVEAIQMLIQHIASQTRTPPHYFFLRGQFPSGESIKSAETGLVAKANRKMRHFGEAWEEVMRLAFQAKDDERAGAASAETIWGDPESRSESEHIDALVKQLAIGVPEEALWEKAGYTPQEIERFKEQRKDEAAVGRRTPAQVAERTLMAAGVSGNGAGDAGYGA